MIKFAKPRLSKVHLIQTEILLVHVVLNTQNIIIHPY